MFNPETLHTARTLQAFGVDWRESLESLDDDFEVDGYRFIVADEIDSIMQDELASDEYMLGCFNACFIADILNIPTDAVEKMQKAEAYEGLGALMMQHIEEVQKQYAAADGYGHHFAHYDGHEHEVRLCGRDYYAFRVN